MNGDFSKQVLHPVKEGEGIHVHQLPTKGGPLYQADKPIADVIEFVEGKLRQQEIVDDSQPVLSTVVIIATGIILTLVAVGLFLAHPTEACAMVTGGFLRIAVGTAVASRPPHRSVREP